MNVVFILFLLCSFLSVSFLYVGFYDAYVTSVQDNECHSIHEVESYVEVKLDFQRRHQTYKLYYSQTQTKPNPIKLKSTDEIQLIGIPILFLPGHGGSFRQGRTFASALHWNSEEMPLFDFFTIDFNEEFTALDGSIIEQQAMFVNRAIFAISKLYQSKRLRMKSLIILAHSMGGVVARTLPLVEGYQHFETVFVTLNTPHSHAPFNVKSSVVSLYNDIRQYWKKNLLNNSHFLYNTTIMSICGGSRDKLIRADLCDMSSFATPRSGFTILTESILGVKMAIDHDCIVWCMEMVRLVSKALISLVELDARRQLTLVNHYDRLHRLKTVFEREDVLLPENSKALELRLLGTTNFHLSRNQTKEFVIRSSWVSDPYLPTQFSLASVGACQEEDTIVELTVANTNIDKSIHEVYSFQLSSQLNSKQAIRFYTQSEAEMHIKAHSKSECYVTIDVRVPTRPRIGQFVRFCGSHLFYSSTVTALLLVSLSFANNKKNLSISFKYICKQCFQTLFSIKLLASCTLLWACSRLNHIHNYEFILKELSFSKQFVNHSPNLMLFIVIPLFLTTTTPIILFFIIKSMSIFKYSNQSILPSRTSSSSKFNQHQEFTLAKQLLLPTLLYIFVPPLFAFLGLFIVFLKSFKISQAPIIALLSLTLPLFVIDFIVLNQYDRSFFNECRLTILIMSIYYVFHQNSTRFYEKIEQKLILPLCVIFTIAFAASTYYRHLYMICFLLISKTILGCVSRMKINFLPLVWTKRNIS